MDNHVYKPYPLVICPYCSSNCIESGGSKKYSLHDHFVKYFQCADIICTQCGKSLDWWDVVYKNILSANEPSTMAILGAESVAIKITMTPKEYKELSLVEYGIPEEANILDISYTHYAGDFFAVETDWYRPKWFPRPHVLKLYPIPNEEGTPEEKPFDVGVFVTWILGKADEVAWQNLIHAFRYYLNRNYEFAIIPANTAVESTLSRLIQNFLERFISKKKVKDYFGNNEAKYSHLLNILLPLSTKLKGITLLCDNIYIELDELRKFRNKMGHNGNLENPIDENKITRLLCAALFGFHYLKFIEPNL
jgi:hypothetical protein